MRYIRFFLTACWLLFVWPHAHWSVWPTLVFLTVATEMESWVSGNIVKALRDVVDILERRQS